MSTYANYLGIPEIYTDKELNDLFQQYISLAKDIEQWNPRVIFIPPVDYAEGLMHGVISIAVAPPESEIAEMSKYKVGDEVKRVRPVGASGLLFDAIGEVQINPFWIERFNDFNALEAEGRDKAEGSFPINAENMKRLADHVFVVWRASDTGDIICREWISEDKLELKS
jgi:hypothetical protein